MRILIFFIITFILFSCTEELDITIPSFGENSILKNSQPITEDTKQRLNGIYGVPIKGGIFGDSVVYKWSGDYLSIFTKNGGVVVLQGGIIDSSIYFEGFWRYATGTETGLIRLFIQSNQGGSDLIKNPDSVKAFKISGSWGSGDRYDSKEVVFEFSRPFSNFILNNDFYILAHRGGGRNSDNLGASENTLEMINRAERLGANGIEIDVKLSKDNIPFLYHDGEINLRLVKESLIWGPVEEFTITQLKSFIVLENGEIIPTLKEALIFVLMNTNLKFVWLDMKSEKNSMAFVIPIQKEINEKAQLLGRDLNVVIGLPDEFTVDNFINYPSFENIPALCELDIENVHATDADIWAPRWTMGTQNELVNQMHSENRLVFTWTIDEVQFIYKFFKEGNFDGMLTNYPSLVSYYHYVRKN